MYDLCNSQERSMRRVLKSSIAKRLLLVWAVVFAFLAASLGMESKAHAYAWMIRHEFTACAQCHADPSGGSLLTQFGRDQSELLLRTYYGKLKKEDREPGSLGDFMFGAFDLPDALSLQTDTRGLALKSFLSQGDDPDPRLVHMQSDLIGQVKVDRLRLNASIGYLHGETGGRRSWLIGTTGANHMVTRHHWIGVDLGKDKQFLLRAGRMNLPFGIRSIEHNLMLRRTTRTDINDGQQHGVALAYTGEKLRGEAMLIAGNFQISPDYFRERGYSAYLEYAVKPRLSIGVNSMITHVARGEFSNRGVPTFRGAHGAYARFAPIRQLVLSAEADVLLTNPKKAGLFAGMASYLTADFEPIQGVHVMATAELQNKRFTRDDYQFGLWGGAAWFFAPHADVRVDVNWAPVAGAANTTTLLGQLHFWL
jgi:hypothetical protein